MSNFTFDEETHTYLLGGVKIPSVTQILRPLYDFSAVHPDVLRRAAEYGTALHKAVELYLFDDLDEADLDENLIGSFSAFKKWWWDEGAKILSGPDLYDGIEKPSYHPKLKYAGTPDLKNNTHVIDLKSRPVNMLTDPLQCAAYDRMDKGDRLHHVLELKQDGTYVFTNVAKTKTQRELNFSKFRYLLDYHNMKSEIERWKL